MSFWQPQDLRLRLQLSRDATWEQRVTEKRIEIERENRRRRRELQWECTHMEEREAWWRPTLWKQDTFHLKQWGCRTHTHTHLLKLKRSTWHHPFPFCLSYGQVSEVHSEKAPPPSTASAGRVAGLRWWWWQKWWLCAQRMSVSRCRGVCHIFDVTADCMITFAPFLPFLLSTFWTKLALVPHTSSFTEWHWVSKTPCCVTCGGNGDWPYSPDLCVDCCYGPERQGVSQCRRHPRTNGEQCAKEPRSTLQRSVKGKRNEKQSNLVENP